jgi:ParB-like chromosome segregation protein Spo0J
LLVRVTIDENAVRLRINGVGLLAALGITEPDPDFEMEPIEHVITAKIATRAGQTKIIIKPMGDLQGGVDPTLIRAIERAQTWFKRLVSGNATSIQGIADAENLSSNYVMRLLRLAFLAPDIVEAIVDGHQPLGLSVKKLTNSKTLPTEWAKQRQRFGFPPV